MIHDSKEILIINNQITEDEGWISGLSNAPWIFECVTNFGSRICLESTNYCPRSTHRLSLSESDGDRGIMVVVVSITKYYCTFKQILFILTLRVNDLHCQ